MNADECNQRAAVCAANAELAADPEVSLAYLGLGGQVAVDRGEGTFIGDLGLPLDQPPVSGTIAGLL
jgi:hypothetical protein